MSFSESGPTSFGNIYQDLNTQQVLSEKSNISCWNPDTVVTEIEPVKEDILKYVAMICSSDKNLQISGLIAIRKLLSLKENPPIQEVIDSGVVPKLLEFMKPDNDTKFQYESAWAVTNICSGTSQDVEYVVSLNGLDVIINLLTSDSVEVIDQAVWALGNIAGDNTTYRNLCLDRECMEKLVGVVTKFPENASIKRNAIWAMSNLLRGKPFPQWYQIAKGIPVLKLVLADNHFGEALIDALWGISWTTESYIQEVIDAGCVPYLVHHLKNNQLSVLIPALRALGNIVTGNDLQTNAVLSCQDFLPRVFELISNPKKTVRKEACWLISNIAAGNQNQIALIINYPHYIEILKKALTQDVAEVVTEAAWALGNLASGATGQQISKMVNEYGYMASVKIMLDNPSPKVKQIGLEATLNVLNSWGGEPEDNIYAKLYKKEGVVEKVKDSMIDATQSLLNIAQDILAQIKDQPEGSEFEEKSNNVEVEFVQQVKKVFEQQQNESEDDVDDYEDEEDEERREAELEKYRITNLTSNKEEDNEKYKFIERED